MRNESSKTGFFSMTLPNLESGHIEAMDYCLNRCDKLVVGLIEDRLCFDSGINPLTTYGQRKLILESLFPQISVMPQSSWTGEDVIKKCKPALVFHSDNYERIPQDGVRNELSALAKKFKFRLHEFSYRGTDQNTVFATKNHSVSKLIKQGVKICAADIHDPISVFCLLEHIKNNETVINSGWGSSLTFSASKLREDTEFYSLQERITEYARMLEDVSLPLLVDGDTGGTIVNLGKSVRLMDDYGMDCLVIEDKVGSKSNSLVSDAGLHQLADFDQMAEKFGTIRQTTKNRDFVAISRLEGLIIGMSPEEVSERAINIIGAGASGVMIHTKDKSPEKVKTCFGLIKKELPDALLMVVPQNIMDIPVAEWFEEGVSIVVYPNQMLRASISGQQKCLERMGRGPVLKEVVEDLIPIPDLINIETKFTSLKS